MEEIEGPKITRRLRLVGEQLVQDGEAMLEPGIANWPDQCERCHSRPPVKTDGTGTALCGRCARKTGEQPFRVRLRPGRNEPCHCDSGKKYKRCCGSPKPVTPPPAEPGPAA